MPATQTTSEDTPKPFGTAGGHALTAANVAGSGSLEITLTAANGTCTLSRVTGPTFTCGGPADAAMTFRGTLYYRLRQVAADGTASYLPVRRVGR